MLYKIKRVARNLKDWIPIIVKDEHWDNAYLYEILYKKLELKEKFFRSDNSHIADWEVVADEIKQVREALKRLKEEDYVPYEEAKKDIVAACQKEEVMIQQDLEIVFDGMKNNVRKWWD